MKRVHLFFDIDGCLIDDNYQIVDDRIYSSCTYAQEYEGMLSMNSNRSLEDILPLYRKLNFDGVIIGENGAFMFDPQSGHYQTYIEPIDVAIQGVHVVKIDTNELVANPEQFMSLPQGDYLFVEQKRLYTKSFYARTIENGIYENPSLFEAIDTKGFAIVPGPHTSMALVSKDCNKATPMKQFSDDIICAIGDSESDIPMFTLSDFSYAPHNAQPRAKNAAHRTSRYTTTHACVEFIRDTIWRYI